MIIIHHSNGDLDAFTTPLQHLASFMLILCDPLIEIIWEMNSILNYSLIDYVKISEVLNWFNHSWQALYCPDIYCIYISGILVCDHGIWYVLIYGMQSIWKAFHCIMQRIADRNVLERRVGRVCKRAYKSVVVVMLTLHHSFSSTEVDWITFENTMILMESDKLNWYIYTLRIIWKLLKKSIFFIDCTHF